MSVNTGALRGGFGAAMAAPQQQTVSTANNNNSLQVTGQQQPQQQQQQQQGSNTVNNSSSNNSSSATAGGGGESQQQMNTLSLCKVGAETVQDIVSRTIELFSLLKSVQLPNGSPSVAQVSVDNRARIQDNINRTRHLFKRLHIIYARVNEDCGGMDYTPIESLIPYRADVESRPDLKKKSDTYRHYSEEVKELKEQLSLRSRYLKDIIDQLRKTIWEINTMLAVRVNY